MMRVHRNAAAKVPAARREPQCGKVEVTRINPRVMKEALRIAEGDASRLELRKDGSVVAR